MIPRSAALALLLLTACRDFHDGDPLAVPDAPDTVDASADADSCTPLQIEACTTDPQCEATLVGLPPCRVARCDTESGGCEVGWIEDGTPCLPSGAAPCGGQCAGGVCVSECR